MGIYLIPEDFPSMDQSEAEDKIRGAEALALLDAPCLAAPEMLTEHQFDAVRAIIKGAILRWNEAGTGVATQMSAGPYSMTATPQARQNVFWPTEKRNLKKICTGGEGRKAFGYRPRLGRR